MEKVRTYLIVSFVDEYDFDKAFAKSSCLLGLICGKYYEGSSPFFVPTILPRLYVLYVAAWGVIFVAMAG